MKRAAGERIRTPLRTFRVAATHITIVMPGLDPGIHDLRSGCRRKAWMAGPSPRQSGFGHAGGSSPAMTMVIGACHTGCCAGVRNPGFAALPKSAVDFPVSAASTRATMCASRSSRACFFRRSRPKITESVALLER